MPGNKINVILLSVFNAADLDNGYQSLNPGGLPQECYRIRVTNNSGNLIFLSFDGATDGEAVLPNASIDLFPPPSAKPLSYVGVWGKGQQIWVTSATDLAGGIYLSGYYV